ncbi:MAG: hypothetical protein CFE24_13210 [Flavobacterium sp. BFFFF2]|nr:MAG: hypothetical protein CFE24_13210 [Flavobacterium sp. BFFFF2]
MFIFFAGPKKTNQKKGPFLARINVIFAFGKTSFQAEISSKDSEILAAKNLCQRSGLYFPVLIRIIEMTWSNSPFYNQ